MDILLTIKLLYVWSNGESSTIRYISNFDSLFAGDKTQCSATLSCHLCKNIPRSFPVSPPNLNASTPKKLNPEVESLPKYLLPLIFAITSHGIIQRWSLKNLNQVFLLPSKNNHIEYCPAYQRNTMWSAEQPEAVAITTRIVDRICAALGD